MKTRVPASLLALLLLAGSASAAAPAPRRIPGSGFDLFAARLPTGMTLVLDRVPGAPGVAAVLAVKTGSADDEPFTGLAHYLEHILFKGTEKYPPGALHAAVESAGGEFNAMTAQDYTAYWVEIPRARYERAIEVLAEAGLRATFPPEEIERERSVIQEERRRREDNPAIRFWDELNRAAFRVHPYGRPGVGTETDIARIAREDLRAFYAENYRPDRMALVVSGDLEWDALVAAVERHFGTLPAEVGRMRAAARNDEDRRRPAEPEWAEPREVRVPAPAARTYWGVAFLGPSGRDAAANAALDLAAELLSGGRAARLRELLVEDLAVADAFSAQWATSRDPDLFVLSGVSEPADFALAAAEAEAGLRALAEAPPDPEALRRAKRGIETAWRAGNESVRTRAFRIAFHWAVQSVEEAARYLERIEAVTPEEVQTAVRRLRPEAPLRFALVPEAAAGPAETEIVLPNGARAILRPDTGAPVATVVLGVLAGRYDEETAGLVPLLAEVLPRGARGKDAEALAAAWERAGLSVSASADADALSITAVGPPDAAGLALRAVFDLATAADLPAGEVETAKARRLRTIRAKRDRPFDLAYDRAKAVLLAGTPYAAPEEGDETGVASLSRDDLARFYRARFVPSRFLLVAEGNFDAAALAAAIRRTFGALPAEAASRRDTPAWSPVPANMPGEPIRIVRPGAAQGLLLAVWPAPPATDPEYPAYKVANAVLGGASQARLFRHLREEEGLAYSVGSFYPTRFGPSLLAAYLGTDPANLSGDSEAALRDRLGAALARATDFDEDELAAAKEKLAGDFLLDRETGARRAWYRIFYESVGLGHEYPDDFPDAVRSVPAEDVRAILRRLYNTPPVVVEVVPEAE